MGSAALESLCLGLSATLFEPSCDKALFPPDFKHLISFSEEAVRNVPFFACVFGRKGKKDVGLFDYILN